MKNAGRSCGVVSPGNIIRVGATVSLDCPNTDTEDVTALLKLWIHSPEGQLDTELPKTITKRSEEHNPFEFLTARWNNTEYPVYMCDQGLHDCHTDDDSPKWKHCRNLQEALDIMPGFWNVSD